MCSMLHLHQSTSTPSCSTPVHPDIHNPTARVISANSSNNPRLTSMLHLLLLPETGPLSIQVHPAEQTNDLIPSTIRSRTQPETTSTGRWMKSLTQQLAVWIGQMLSLMVVIQPWSSPLSALPSGALFSLTSPLCTLTNPVASTIQMGTHVTS